MEKIVKLLTSVLVILAMAAFCSCAGDGGGSGDGSGNGGDGPEPYLTYGLNFSPYTRPGQDPNLRTIIPEAQIKSHLEILTPYAEWIRTFGSTLGMEHAAKIAFDLNYFTAIGAWLDYDLGTNDEEMLNLIAAAKAGHVDLAIIGSEALLREDLTLDDLIYYIEWFQTEVPDVPVTTAETSSIWLNNLGLIDYVDVVMVNYYSYWEGIPIDEAVSYIHNRHQRIVAKASDKQVIVSETGWPSDGDTKGQAVPSAENSAFYFLNFVSWARAEKIDYFYFEAFDEPWKAGYEGPQGAHWGVWDKDGNMKDGMMRVFDGETMNDNWTGECTPGGSGIPKIEFTYVPPKGSYKNLNGQVWHVDTNLYGVAVYIYVNGWWTKPYWNKPVATIACSGYFSCDITTGGIDQKATRIAAFLIPFDYGPPLMGGGGTLPQELYDNAVDYIIVDR